MLKKKNFKIRKKSANFETPYKNPEKYGLFSKFRTSAEKSVILAILSTAQNVQRERKVRICANIIHFQPGSTVYSSCNPLPCILCSPIPVILKPTIAQYITVHRFQPRVGVRRDRTKTDPAPPQNAVAILLNVFHKWSR